MSWREIRTQTLTHINWMIMMVSVKIVCIELVKMGRKIYPFSKYRSRACVCICVFIIILFLFVFSICKCRAAPSNEKEEDVHSHSTPFRLLCVRK